jgi:hypothetical protein
VDPGKEGMRAKNVAKTGKIKPREALLAKVLGNGEVVLIMFYTARIIKL